jgi:hypothetical protein
MQRNTLGMIISGLTGIGLSLQVRVSALVYLCNIIKKPVASINFLIVEIVELILTLGTDSIIC